MSTPSSAIPAPPDSVPASRPEPERSPADPVLAQALLERLSVDAWRDDQGRTLLLAAIEDDDVALVTYLAPRSNLRKVCEIAGDAVTPLMYAARQGRAACVRVLLDHGPAEQPLWNAGDKGDQPALDLAVRFGHRDCIALLAPLSNLHERQRLFPLVDAAQRADLETMKLLLPFCPVNGRKPYGHTALEAVIWGDSTGAKARSPERNACFDLLLDHPDVQIVPPGPDSYDHPTHKLLFDAIDHHQAYMVQRLAVHFDLNQLAGRFFGGRWAGRCTPLHHAVYWGALDSLEALLPGSREALMLPASGGETHGKTPVELALDMVAQTPSMASATTSLRIADALVAHGIRLGLDVPRPSMTQKDGSPLPPDEARAMWPRLHQALEERELVQALNEVPAPAQDASARHRL